MPPRVASVGKGRVRVESVTPFLWLERDAEKAARLYTSLLAGSKVISAIRASVDAGTVKKGGVILVEFVLAGQRFLALNGGSDFKPNPAFSIYVSCPGQREVDRLWKALLRGGKTMACGWLTDRFGISWQIIPRRLPELLADRDREKAARVMTAMMGMVKIDVAELERAAKAR